MSPETFFFKAHSNTMKALLKGGRRDRVAENSYSMLYKNIVPKTASKGTKKIILSAEAEVKPIAMTEKHPFSWRYIRSRGKSPRGPSPARTMCPEPFEGHQVLHKLWELFSQKYVSGTTTTTGQIVLLFFFFIESLKCSAGYDISQFLLFFIIIYANASCAQIITGENNAVYKKIHRV